MSAIGTASQYYHNYAIEDKENGYDTDDECGNEVETSFSSQTSSVQSQESSSESSNSLSSWESIHSLSRRVGGESSDTSSTSRSSLDSFSFASQASPPDRPGSTYSKEEIEAGYDDGDDDDTGVSQLEYASTSSSEVLASDKSSVSSDETISSDHFFSSSSSSEMLVSEKSSMSSSEATSSDFISSVEAVPLENSFGDGFNDLCTALAMNPHSEKSRQNVYATLESVSQHFGKVSVRRLGAGSNSSAFVVETPGAHQKQILRLVSPQKLYMMSFRLTSSYVGGEWLSVTVGHPNLAGNTHIIAWDSRDRTYKILNQEQVKALIANPKELEGSDGIYAVGTIGNFTDGARDLEQIVSERGAIPDQELQPMLKDLFEGVAELNRSSTCHRDLKLSNVIHIPSSQAHAGKTQVIDFGTAAIVNSEGRARTLGGDTRVHPPESFAEKRYTGLKTDSYSLFRMVYHLSTGRDFFEGVASKEEFKAKHETISQAEKEEGFQSILLADPNLKGADRRLIDLMSRLGTSEASDRILAEEALNMPYFKTRDVVVLNAA